MKSKCYLIYANRGYDSDTLLAACRNLEIAEKKKQQHITQINFLKSCYKERTGNDYDEDVVFTNDENYWKNEAECDVIETNLILFAAEFPEIKTTDIYIQETELL